MSLFQAQVRTTALCSFYNEVLVTGGELISHFIPGSMFLFSRGLDFDSEEHHSPDQAANPLLL